ncbi:MAG: ATP-grasp domain-containing protein [Archangium sp.]
MHWVLQNDIFDEAGWRALRDALERLELPFSVHKVVPFVGELIPAPQLSTDNVICMGSYSMRHVAKRERWSPGVFDLEPFDFRAQLAHWGEHLLNAHSVVTRFADVRFVNDEHFVRPVSDSKVFAGKVMTRAEFEPWQRSVCQLGEDDGSTMTSDTLVQLAMPRVVHAEYRCWIVKGELVTASLYKRGQRAFASADVPESMKVYARARVAEWQPHEAFVLDVCETEDGPRVVEINTLNAAGFYAADMQRLVAALEAAFNRRTRTSSER